MTSDAIADAYWAAHLGCAPEQLFASPMSFVPHGGELAGYWGVFALCRGAATIVSAPPERLEKVTAALGELHEGCTPEQLAVALRGMAHVVIGPASIAYATEISGPGDSARSLAPADAAACAALAQSCEPLEWEHGGSALDAPASGVFVGKELAALAGYEVWGGTIAQISIVTGPKFRGRGFGRQAVAHLARRALEGGLLPQYRTLVSNGASIRIAETLGFTPYAVSIAARLR